MAPGPTRIDTLEGGLAALAAASDGPVTGLEVLVTDVVPRWLGELVARAQAAGITVDVVAEPAGIEPGEALDGWEIGVATAALAAGVREVRGVDPKRVRRVRAVIDAIDHAGTTEVVA